MDAARYAVCSREVADAFVAAYPQYVRRRLAQLGVPGGAVEEAIEQGRSLLVDAFAPWRDADPEHQKASPLELFREALTSPTEAARVSGVPPPLRDALQAQALPGDVFELAPATSRDIGDDAWRAHVAWGVARAEAIAGMVPRSASPPAHGVRVALVGTDLMDRTRIGDAATAAGCELILWRNPGAVSAGLDAEHPAIAFVDLSHPSANEAIAQLAAARVRTIAFGPHVDDVALAAAGALGADEVLPRARFFHRLATLFPRAL